jgi:hypothetical protein
MRVYWRVAIILSMLIGVFIAVRQAAGYGEPPASAILDVAGCAHPCWNGLRPNQNTIQEAHARLSADARFVIMSVSRTEICWRILAGPFQGGCAYSWRDLGTNNDRIEIINLFVHPGAFRLGDAVLAFGPPTAHVLPCGLINGNVYFQGNVIAIVAPGATRFGPETAVEYLSYVTTATPWFSRNVPPWRGFVRGSHGRAC